MTLWWFQLWMIIFMILKTKNTSDQYKDLRFIPSPHHELRATSYKLISLRVALIARVTCYFLHASYELLFIGRVGSYFLHTSYKLLFIAQVASYFCCTITCYCLFHELRVTVYCTSCELPLACDLRLNFCMAVASYFLTMSYNTDEDDKIAYDNQIMIKNYSLRSFLDKELEVR